MPFKEDSYENNYSLDYTNDGILVGYVHGVLIGKSALLQKIWKDKDNGYSGLGRDLLSKFELWALSQHATAIIGMFAPELDREEEARTFYKRNDFSIDHGNRLYKRLT